VIVALGLTALVAIGGNNWRARAATNRFVAVGGSDTGNDCSNMGSPCATIQHAIGQSASGDFIQLGPGKYFENVIVNQSVTIQGDATIGSTVDGNNAGRVFGIEFGVVATLNMLTITNGKVSSGETMTGTGGGIANIGTLTVVQCTITGNQATAVGFTGGGGIFNGGGALTVINSTISGNSTVGFGGGLWNQTNPESLGMATLVNVTINGNTAATGGGVSNAGGETLNLTNTIIAGSTSGGDCFNTGVIGTNSHNLVQDSSCTPAVSGDPKLGPLQNNGGPTFTHALLAGSPAIDAGDDSVLGAPLNLSTDQRGPGFPRKVGSHVDIGAFEAQFNTCLRDNTSGNILQWNTATGQYKFTRCSDGFMLTGTGVVGLTNGIKTLTDFKSDRRISAGFNTGQLTGNATIYLMVTQGVWQSFQIVDTNPAAVCNC
jgi:hypothetical protein